MIKGKAELEFGTGDICIASGYTKREDDKITGFVLFDNQEPRKIGCGNGDIKAGGVDIEKYPVVMEFNKKESIDVIIKILEDAKSFMN